MSRLCLPHQYNMSRHIFSHPQQQIIANATSRLHLQSSLKGMWIWLGEGLCYECNIYCGIFYYTYRLQMMAPTAGICRIGFPHFPFDWQYWCDGTGIQLSSRMKLQRQDIQILRQKSQVYKGSQFNLFEEVPDHKSNRADPPAHSGSNNDSIINELNQLDADCRFESRVVNVESFIYAEEKNDSSPYEGLKDSCFNDENGSAIPPIGYFDLVTHFEHRWGVYGSKRNEWNLPEGKDGKNRKSIRQQIMQENKLLERRLTYKEGSGHRGTTDDKLKGTVRKTKSKEVSASGGAKFRVQARETGETNLHLIRLEEQYNKSKVLKLYNFIMQALPLCRICGHPCSFLEKSATAIVLGCKNKHRVGHNGTPGSTNAHPFMGVLFDLQNKQKFEEEAKSYQKILIQIEKEISLLQLQILELQALREKVTQLKSTNRRKYKQINESKYFLKKQLETSNYQLIPDLVTLLPLEYLQQMEGWCAIKASSAARYKQLAAHLNELMPIYIKSSLEFKLEDSINKILNYDRREEAIRIFISESVKFPLKVLEKAVFVVDGSYNATIFQKIGELELQFQNKKTLRELFMLFNCLPREMYSLSFAYNHKLHSHISAENFPFLSTAAALTSLRKLSIRIDNVKQFDDALKLVDVLTPKIELRIIISKNIFSKKQLILHRNYYQELVGLLGRDIVRIHIQLPESSDSVAVLPYEYLIKGDFPYLCQFSINRGDKNRERSQKMHILEELKEEKIKRQDHVERIFKKMVAKRCQCVRLIKAMKNQGHQGQSQVVRSITNMIV